MQTIRNHSFSVCALWLKILWKSFFISQSNICNNYLTEVLTIRTVEKIMLCWLSKNPAMWLLGKCNWTHSKQKTLLEFFQRYWWSKIHAIVLHKKCNWLHVTKRVSPRCYLCLMTSSWKKSKRFLFFFQKYWWSNNPEISPPKNFFLNLKLSLTYWPTDMQFLMALFGVKAAVQQ